MGCPSSESLDRVTFHPGSEAFGLSEGEWIPFGHKFIQPTCVLRLRILPTARSFHCFHFAVHLNHFPVSTSASHFRFSLIRYSVIHYLSYCNCFNRSLRANSHSAITTQNSEPEFPFVSLLELPDRPLDLVAQFINCSEVRASANTCEAVRESLVLELELRWEIHVDSHKHSLHSEPFYY